MKVGCISCDVGQLEMDEFLDQMDVRQLVARYDSPDAEVRIFVARTRRKVA